jgi:uncharacterized damage-inducible protein DinB
MADASLEVWLRGPVEGVPAQLQPVAHALLQALEEVRELTADLPAEILWSRPAGVASAGFHLRHMTGVVDRLFTYARGEQLDEHQRRVLQAESQPPGDEVTAAELLSAFELQVEGAIEMLRRTDEADLSNVRGVGRKAVPSTARGLFFHAAEHVQRHLGQLLVTVRVQRRARDR